MTNDHSGILHMTSITEAIDEQLCDAANFLAAEGASARTFHRHGRELWHRLSDSYMRAKTTKRRAWVLAVMDDYHRSLEALNEDLRKLSERLP